MLRRILIIVAVLYLVWRILAGWGRRLSKDRPGADSFSRFSSRGRDQRRRAAAEEPEELVACAHCGTYVPVARALTAGDGSFYCSRACREAGAIPAEHGGAGG